MILSPQCKPAVINYLKKAYNLFRYLLFKGLNKDEKPPPPPPAPKPRKPSQEESHEAVIITLEGLKVSQVLPLIPPKYIMFLELKLLCIIPSYGILE